MSTKRKSAPQNPLVYLWNEFLFARSFEYAVSLTPEQCCIALEGLNYNFMRDAAKDSPPDMRRIVTFQPGGDEAEFGFEIAATRYQNNRVVTSVRAEGSVTVYPDTGKTIVQGRATFHKLTYLAGIVVLLMIILGLLSDTAVRFPFEVKLVLIGFILAAGGVSWWNTWTERNRLHDLIGMTLREAESAANLVEKSKRAEIATDDSLTYHRKQL